MDHHFIPIKPAIIDWRDDVPFSLQYDDIYYSAESGIEQSRHVFINGNDLISRWKALSEPFSCFNIAETGFGTGLNFLQTWHLWEQHAPPGARLQYFSCEKHPLTKDDLIRSLAFWPQLEKQAQELIHHYPVLTPGYHLLSFAQGRVSLNLMLGDAYECFEQLLLCGDTQLESELQKAAMDAWYLDGFAPKKNEHMWSEELMKVIALLSKEGTTLATYSAAAVVKSTLNNYGFVVEKKKGFGPKRHMICARFTKTPPYHIKSRHTPWHLSNRTTRTDKSAIIVGAGLAGCTLAKALAQRGWTVRLLEELEHAGQAGSGNQQAVLFPKLSAYQSPLTQFMLSSFLYAAHFYQKILNECPIGELKGSLLLAYNEKEKKAQDSLKSWLADYPELGELVAPARATQLSGIAVAHSGLFIPQSGWINSPFLCHHLIDDKNIQLVTGKSVNSFVFENQQWQVDEFQATVLILSNGHKLQSFEQTHYLPIKAIQGQMSAIVPNPASSGLKIPLCAEGHVLPAQNNRQWFGATYNLGRNTSRLCSEDDLLNQSKLERISAGTPWPEAIVDHWAGIRATTPDYLPLAGPVPKEKEFLDAFQGLERNAKRWIPRSGVYHPSLYVFAGFGSRGVTTIPLASEWLASHINNELSYLPRDLIQAISPARFLRREIIRRFNEHNK